MPDVTVEWLKWPSEPYRTTPMRRLGTDEHGTWLYAPRGTAASYTRTGPAPLPVHFLTLVPTSAQGWVATWMWGNPTIDIDVYVDIVHQPTWLSASVLRVVDMDLDVIRRTSGHVFLDDEDEFNQHMVSREYPAALVHAARASADALVERVAQRQCPFGGESLRWLDVVGEQGSSL